jgi:DNA-directed RNA polymerase alpha subunit
MATPLDETDLPTRTINCLRACRITTVGDLVARTRGDLLRVPDVGRKSLRDILDLLARHELELTEQVHQSASPVLVSTGTGRPHTCTRAAGSFQDARELVLDARS